jgi:hypothetical protein
MKLFPPLASAEVLIYDSHSPFLLKGVSAVSHCDRAIKARLIAVQLVKFDISMKIICLFLVLLAASCASETDASTVIPQARGESANRVRDFGFGNQSR